MSLFALRDIPYRRSDKEALLGLQRAEADLGGKLGPVLSTRREHLRRDSSGGQPLPSRNQGLDISAEQLRPPEPEHDLDLRIHQIDHAVA